MGFFKYTDASEYGAPNTDNALAGDLTASSGAYGFVENG
jgi:hypothetical protein